MDLLLGRYRRMQSLGAGAMGQVWLAEDVLLNRTVAVKQLRTDGAMSDQATHDRMVREARLAAQLNHPNAVAVHDLLFDAGGQPYVIMEYVAGETLGDRLRTKGPMNPDDAARLIAQVAGALEIAHSRGIVHRDVKPGNILISPDGTAKLADFGIARSTIDPNTTATGLVVGTPAFLPPEIARGATPSPASDIWALGATMYDAVEGHPPYVTGDASESTIALLTRVVSTPVPPATRAGRYSSVLADMLHSDPAQRPSAGTVRSLLQSGGGPAAAPVAGRHNDAPTTAVQWSSPPAEATIQRPAGPPLGATMPRPAPAEATIQRPAGLQPEQTIVRPTGAATSAVAFGGPDPTAAVVLPPSVNPHGSGRPVYPSAPPGPGGYPGYPQGYPPPPVEVFAAAPQHGAPVASQIEQGPYTPPPPAVVEAPLPTQNQYQEYVPPQQMQPPRRRSWWPLVLALALLVIVGVVVFVIVTDKDEPRIAQPTSSASVPPQGTTPPVTSGPTSAPPPDVPVLPKAADPVPVAKPPAAPGPGVRPYTKPAPVPVTVAEVIEYQPALTGDPAAAVASVRDFMIAINKQDFQAAWNLSTHAETAPTPSAQFVKDFTTSAHYQVAFGQPRALQAGLIAVPIRFVSRQQQAGAKPCSYWPQYVALVHKHNGKWLRDTANRYIDLPVVAPLKRGGSLNPGSQEVSC